MTYRSPTTAMNHQAEALRASANKPTKPSAEDVFAYLMEMGTGKSKVGLDEFGEYATSGGPRDLLIWAPAGCYKNWYEDKSDLQRSEINVHCDPEFRERLVDVGWVSGSKRQMEKINAMMRVRDKGRPRALIMNIEALSTVEKARTLCKEFLEQRGGMCIIDESTMIKGGSKRSRHAITIGHEAQVRRIMTGLITPKSPMDLFYQMSFLDWRILKQPSWFSFRARYAVTRKMQFAGQKRPVDIIVGFKNMDELQGLLGAYSYRALKEDCLDLEDKTYMIEEVEQTDQQRRHYQELTLFGNTSIGEDQFVSVTNVLSRMMRMHQINTGFVIDEEGNRHKVPEKRTDALMNVLSRHDGKSVIWTNYLDPIDKIKQRIRDEFKVKHVAEFSGRNKSTRAEDERRFLGDPECRHMVATQGAGMRGNTWIVADLEVYYSNDYDLEKRWQSEDRLHRKGQTKKVTIVDLICPGTVDEKIVKALRKKIDMSTVITGENYKEWLV